MCPMALDWAAVLSVGRVQGGVAAGMSGARDLFGGPVAGQVEAPAVPQGVGEVPVRTTRVQMQVKT